MASKTEQGGGGLFHRMVCDETLCERLTSGSNRTEGALLSRSFTGNIIGQRWASMPLYMCHSSDEEMGMGFDVNHHEIQNNYITHCCGIQFDFCYLLTIYQLYLYFRIMTTKML